MQTVHMATLPDPIRQAEFYADVPVKRLFAWLIDGVIGLALSVMVLPFTFFAGLLFFPFLWLMVSFAYRVVTIANGSATWGMRFMAIELRNARGQRLTLGEAFLHTLGYSLSIGTLLVQAVSVVLMLSSDRKQGLHDMVLGIVALNRTR